ncbi:methyl-accepting chemotaxis protein, partial [Anoxybacillus ayderensis]|uniref:HAMP domain-containing methyl-accepting chemotaxis protein n=1 Tax=Anoxybacillus ayderensis TaxID=265546 RepID=UPI002E1D54EF
KLLNYSNLEILLKEQPEQIERLQVIRQNYYFWMSWIDKVIRERKYYNAEEAFAMIQSHEGKNYMDKIRAHIHMVIEHENKISGQRIKALNKRIFLAKMITIFLPLIAILLSVYFGIRLSKTIKVNVDKISKSIKEIASAGGDLTKRIQVNTRDELALLADDTNKLIESIGRLVREVSDLVEHVTESSQELAISAEETSKTIYSITETAEHIAEGSEKINYRMEDSLHKMQQLKESAHVLDESAKRVKQEVKDMNSSATAGKETVIKASEVMKGIEEQINDVTSSIESLGRRSKEITKIIQTITDIANQTNLLALNAAIEAARAGENGKGFAVVAKEVRNLSEQSQMAAQDVKNIIYTIQREIEMIVEKNRESVEGVKTGVQTSEDTTHNLEKILFHSQETAKVVNEMVEQIQKTMALSEEVSDLFTSVHDVTMETSSNIETTVAATEEGAAAMEQIATSADGLLKRAEKLRGLISNFRI